MSKEMYWLTLTLLATALFWLPYVLDRMVVVGLMGTFANPSPDHKPLHAWAQRAKAAHANAIESLVLFAPAVLAVQILQRGDALTGTACAVYFVSRLVHYLAYTAGIPFVRTLAFFGGCYGIFVLLLRLLGLV